MAEKQIIDQEYFNLNGTDYIARLYHPAGKTYIYGEIVYKKNEERPYRQMRNIARSFLKPYGIVIPTVANSNVTHEAIKKLIAVLRGEQ